VACGPGQGDPGVDGDQRDEGAHREYDAAGQQAGDRWMLGRATFTIVSSSTSMSCAARR
jgi:hypothetical protein